MSTAEGPQMTCEDLKLSVRRWIDDEFECQKSQNDCLVATLPLLKPNGDAIEVGIEPLDANRWRVSDLGDTYATLYLAGVGMLEEYVRTAEFAQIKQDHKIVDENELLSVDYDPANLVEGIFDFAHALQSILALQVTVRPGTVLRDFPSIVAKFLGEQQVSFEIPPQNIDGRSGRWKFHFSLNHSQPETLVKAISPSSRRDALGLAERSVFEINDVKAIRPSSQAVVIADDEDDRGAFWQPNVLRVCKEYGVPLILFGAGRNELVELATKHPKQP